MTEEWADEKSEPASQKRREDARKEGQVARSVDLSAALTLIGGLLSLACISPALIRSLVGLMRETFKLAGAGTLDMATLQGFRFDSLVAVLFAMGGILILIMCLGIASSILQVGLVITPELISPKWDRVNPVNGFSRLVSLATLTGFAAGMLKLTAVFALAYLFVSALFPAFPGLSQLPVQDLLPYTANKISSLCWRISLAFLAIGAVDYLFQWWRHEKSLRMSRQELKEEHKQQEGDPQIKQRIRQIQRQRAAKRMMEDVPKATVVVTNPTHVAIALRYDPKSMDAPVVMAKGERRIAQRIKQIAYAHGIHVVEEPPLARALLRATEIGQAIPPVFYHAVAQVLAVFLRKQATAPQLLGASESLAKQASLPRLDSRAVI